MPVRKDPVLGLTSRRNVPKAEVVKSRARHVNDLLSATPEVNRVVVVTDRYPGLWEEFEAALAIPDDREVNVQLVHPSDIASLHASGVDMVFVDRFSPNEPAMSDENVADMLSAQNLKDAAYRGLWPDYLDTRVLGLPALMQGIKLREAKATQPPAL